MSTTFKNLIILTLFFIITSCENEISQDDFTPIKQLNFEEVKNFDPNEIEGISMGMTWVNSENAIYISSRDDYPLEIGSNREQIVKVNLENNESDELIFNKSDFITKHLFIYNNDLVSLGGQLINKYDFNLSQNIVSTSHGRFLSQFGLVKSENDLLIIGGDLNENNSNKVYNWNPEFPTVFQEFTSLPSNLYGSAGFITEDDTLFILGGTTDKLGVQLNTDIYAINMDNPETIMQFEMPEGINITYLKVYKEHVLISGRIYQYDISGKLTGRNSVIYDFDYQSKTFTKIETNLTNPDGYHVIGQMEVVENQLYIMYGSYITNNIGDSLETEWTLYKADLF